MSDGIIAEQIDGYIEMWQHDLLGSNGVADLMDALIAERNTLKEGVRLMTRASANIVLLLQEMGWSE